MDADPWADAPPSPSKPAPSTAPASGGGGKKKKKRKGGKVQAAIARFEGSDEKEDADEDVVKEGGVEMSGDNTAETVAPEPPATTPSPSPETDTSAAIPASPIAPHSPSRTASPHSSPGIDPYAAPAPAVNLADDDFDEDLNLEDDTGFTVSLPPAPETPDEFSDAQEDITGSMQALVVEAPPPPGDDFDDNDAAFEEQAFDGGDDGFGDFDDFGAPAASFEDDGFGDFEDFEESKAVPPDTPSAPPPPLRQASVIDWSALSLRPIPPQRELLSRISVVLAPLVPESDNFTDEAPRDVGGLSQVLATESSRDTFAQLTTAPMLKPLDWTRSRVRRDHLISMGVPVNLDEVDSHRLSTLPPLQITATFPRSQSVGPEPLRRSTATPPVPERGAGAARQVGGSEEERKYGLGEKPALDIPHAEELCGLDEDQLSLLPLSRLETIQSDLAKHTAEASALLAWFLQLKDAQSQDAATYNGMISELIANAAKVKGGSTGGGLFKRNSSRPASMSATPRRVGSPGQF